MAGHPPVLVSGREGIPQELLAELGERAGENHVGPELAESEEQKALRIVEQELRRRRWTREQLTQWRKGDKRKVRIALRLRRETTRTLKWISEQLAMGTRQRWPADCMKQKLKKRGTDPFLQSAPALATEAFDHRIRGRNSGKHEWQHDLVGLL